MKAVFYALLLIKILCLAVFSSDWLDLLFLPFVTHYLQSGMNPWETYLNPSHLAPFPYPPVMLYLHSLFVWPAVALDLHQWPLVSRFLFKLPCLLADLGIYFLLLRLYPLRQREVLFFYFASPLLFFAVYMHSQLDLLPTAALFYSAWYLGTNRLVQSALCFSLALALKTHVIAAMPLFLTLLLRRKEYQQTLFFVLFALLPFSILCLPYIQGFAFVDMVFKNPEQSLTFSLGVGFGEVKLLLAPLACLLIYLRFLSYYKINRDLFFAFLGLLFSVFVLCVPPMPGWYVWMVPFLSLLFIQIFERRRGIIYLFCIFHIAYLSYFLLVHDFALVPLRMLSQPLVFASLNPLQGSIVFTLLWGSLFLLVAAAYTIGVRSNLAYRSRSVGMAIGIGGDSGAGKTTLLQDLKDLFGARLLDLEGDADHRWERGDESWARFTHLDPKANHLHRQADDILTLKRGKSIFRGEYDHLTGRFKRPRRIDAADYVVLSGLHPFYLPKMRKLLDLKIYFDTDEPLRRYWKIRRDTRERGYSLEKILKQIESRVADTQKYIYPQRAYADLIVQYFATSLPDPGDSSANPDLGLRLTFSASINTESLIHLLRLNRAEFEWDYSDDLHNQVFTFLRPPASEVLMQIASRLIFGLEEFIQEDVRLTDGYRGLVQLSVLLLVSESTRQLLLGEEDYAGISL